MERSRRRGARRTTTISALILAMVGAGLVVGSTPAAGSAPPPALVPGLTTITEGDAGTTTVEIPVTLTEPTTETVTATWQTIHGPGVEPPDPATPDDDFAAADGTLTIPPGQTTATIALQVDGDTQPEADEYIVVAFSHPTGAALGGFYGLGFAIIEDDDALPGLTGGRVDRAEGDSGTTLVELTATLAAPFRRPITIDWQTVSGSGCPGICIATEGEDFTGANGTVTIPAGQTTATIVLEVYGDTTPEEDEHVIVEFSRPGSGELLSYGRVVLEDDDTPVVEPPPRLLSPGTTVVEGDAGTTSVQLAVGLSKPWHEDIAIGWAIEPGSGCPLLCFATEGVDYAAASGTVTIPAGQTSATVTLSVYGDTLVEPDEFFSVGFRAPATSNRLAYGTVRIPNDD